MLYEVITRDKVEFQFELINQSGGLYYKTREKNYPVFAISDFEFVIPEQDWRLSILKDNLQVDSLKFRLEYGRGIASRKKLTKPNILYKYVITSYSIHYTKLYEGFDL